MDKEKERELLRWIKNQLEAMTPKMREILKILLTEQDEWVTRKQLAARLGKHYLQRHDIETLDKLLAGSWIDSNKERLMDELIRQGHERPRSFKGRAIAYQSRFYSYRVTPSFAPVLGKMLLYRKPTPKEAHQMQPGKEYRPSLGDRIEDWFDRLGL